MAHTLEQVLRTLPFGNEFIVRVSHEKGKVLHAYIRPANTDGVTEFFAVFDNEIHFDKDVHEAPQTEG